MSTIKNIIFDLGVVLYDINQKATHNALTELGIKNVTTIFTLQQQNNLCDQFEVGKIDETTFFNELKKLTTPESSIAQLKTAWQAMLIGLPQDKFLLLNELRKKYTIMVLSNTNSTHIEKINASLLENYNLSSIHELFDHTYLSFEVGLRKPSDDIFKHVIEQANIKPSETLFIDDLNLNVNAAKCVGIEALLYKQGDNLRNLLYKKLIFANNKET